MEQKIVFVTNTDKANAISVRNEAICIAQEQGFSCLEIDPFVPQPASVFKNASFIAAFGGDGTILKAVPIAVAHDLPILGVNLGRVGFLSEIQPDEFGTVLAQYREGALSIENRMMVSCSVNGVRVCDCLNDVLLYKPVFSGVTHISMCIDGEDAGTVFCDGMIVSTPTGSTGYSISVGGPIISPGLEACILVPVCPHSLLVRPIVTAPDAQIELRMKSNGILYADGQKTMDVNMDDQILVTKSDHQAKFLRVGAHNLYSLIKQKLS